jgi:trimeric autotransporter adhesin
MRPRVMNQAGRSSRNDFVLILALVSLSAVCTPSLEQSNPIGRLSSNDSMPTANLANRGTLAAASTENTLPAEKAAASLSSLPAGAQGPISAALGKDDSGYWLRQNGEGFRGENQRQALSMVFTKQGTEINSHNQRWALETRAYGYGTALLPVKEAVPQANANRVEYRRDGITEWYENGPLGLEQGFTLAHRPGSANGQPLTLALELRGDLSAALEPAGFDKSALDKKSTTLELRGKDGKAALRYTGLSARDASGRELQSWLEVKGEQLLVRVEDAGAKYPVVVDPLVQQAELTASDGAESDEFGGAVAVSGSTIVIGAPFHANTGAAYVFVQNGGAWNQQAELTPSDGETNDEFGYAVAISGGTAVVGSYCHPATSQSCGPGAAYVYTQSGTTWSQQDELTAPDGVNGDFFGYSVAVSGSIAVVGAPDHTENSNSQQGAGYAFEQSGTTWSAPTELIATDGAQNDTLGYSAAISGSTVVLGAPGHAVGSNSGQGAGYVFVESGTIWTQQAELTASDGAANDGLGLSAVISGSTALLGAPEHTVGSNSGQGAAYVFAQSGTTWAQQAELTSSDGASSDFFGYSVALSGGTAVVGGPLHMVGSNAVQGATYVFTESGTTWSQEAELTSSDGGSGDAFGDSVAISGSLIFAGAQGHTFGSNGQQGAAYVFAPGTTATLTPASQNFGNVAVDITSEAKTVTLKNTGTITLDISGISVAPTTNFTISSNTCGTTLAVNKSCKVSTTFTAAQPGEVTGTLTFSGNIIGAQTVALSGTGVAQATLTPIDISFPTTKVGKTTTQSVVLKNNVATALTGISYSVSAPFGVSPDSTCGTTLNSKGSCIFKVTFSPTATGSATGTLTVTDSANNSPQTVTMEGDAD